VLVGAGFIPFSVEVSIVIVAFILDDGVGLFKLFNDHSASIARVIGLVLVDVFDLFLEVADFEVADRFVVAGLLEALVDRLNDGDGRLLGAGGAFDEAALAGIPAQMVLELLAPAFLLGLLVALHAVDEGVGEGVVELFELGEHPLEELLAVLRVAENFLLDGLHHLLLEVLGLLGGPFQVEAFVVLGVVEDVEGLLVVLLVGLVHEHQRVLAGRLLLTHELGVVLVDGEGQVIDLVDHRLVLHKLLRNPKRPRIVKFLRRLLLRLYILIRLVRYVFAQLEPLGPLDLLHAPGYDHLLLAFVGGRSLAVGRLQLADGSDLFELVPFSKRLVVVGPTQRRRREGRHLVGNVLLVGKVLAFLRGAVEQVRVEQEVEAVLALLVVHLVALHPHAVQLRPKHHPLLVVLGGEDAGLARGLFAFGVGLALLRVLSVGQGLLPSILFLELFDEHEISELLVVHCAAVGVGASGAADLVDLILKVFIGKIFLIGFLRLEDVVDRAHLVESGVWEGVLQGDLLGAHPLLRKHARVLLVHLRHGLRISLGEIVDVVVPFDGGERKDVSATLVLVICGHILVVLLHHILQLI